MKAKELQSLPAPNGKTWTVGGLVGVDDQMGTSIRKVTRITDGRGGTVYIGKVNLVGQESEVAYDSYGRMRGGDIWSCNHAYPISDEEAQAIMNTNKARRIACSLYKHNWNELPHDKLLAIHEALVALGVNVLEKKVDFLST